jgi:chromosome segregation ATPase
MLIVSMKEEKKLLYKEIKDLNQEVIEQASEHKSAKDVLIRAREELEKVLQSKKAILMHLQKALLKLEDKNKILLIEREVEHEKSEENLMKTAELLGMEKETQKVNKLSALWDEVLENLRKEMRQLEQEKTKLQEKMDKLINEGGMLQKATQSTEDQIKEIDKELSKKSN